MSTKIGYAIAVRRALEDAQTRANAVADDLCATITHTDGEEDEEGEWVEGRDVICTVNLSDPAIIINEDGRKVVLVIDEAERLRVWLNDILRED